MGEWVVGLNHTFVCRAWYTLHNRPPLHEIVIRGPEVKQRIVGVVLVCLQLRHQALDGRCVACGTGHCVYSVYVAAG